MTVQIFLQVYDWDNKSILLSSFFWGYSALQIIAAMLSRIYGSKSLLIGAMAINSMACCLIPLAAEYLGANGVMLSRAVMGLSQGFFFPSVYNILAHWIPPSERAQMGSSALAGKIVFYDVIIDYYNSKYNLILNG